MPNTPPTPPINPNAPQGPQQPDDNIQVPGKGFTAKPMHWLGMDFNSDEATKLWQTVIQMVNREIERDKQKALKTIRDFDKDDADKSD